MKALGVALFIVGYALFYSGASNLFTGGQGWGFLQALLNKGTANASASKPNSGASGGSSGSSGSSGTPGWLKLPEEALGGVIGGVQGLLGGQ